MDGDAVPMVKTQAGPLWVELLALTQADNSVLIGKPMCRDGLSAGPEESRPALFEAISSHPLDSHPPVPPLPQPLKGLWINSKCSELAGTQENIASLNWSSSLSVT